MGGLHWPACAASVGVRGGPRRQGPECQLGSVRLAMGLSAMPPPSLSPTGPMRADLQRRVHVPQGNKEWPLACGKKFLAFNNVYLHAFVSKSNKGIQLYWYFTYRLTQAPLLSLFLASRVPHISQRLERGADAPSDRELDGGPFLLLFNFDISWHIAIYICPVQWNLQILMSDSN